MRLSDFLSPELILVDIQVEDKWQLLDLMAEAVMKSPAFRRNPDLTVEQVREAIVAREKEGSTGVGNGYAFPHARMPKFQGLAACMATLRTPIDFQSIDGTPVNLACMLVVPQEQPTVTLKVMSQLAEMLSPEYARHFFDTTHNPRLLYDFIRQHSREKDEPITAKDIMREPLFEVYPDTPLSDVTHKMQQFNLDATSIVDRDGRLVGIITCDLLFKFGMPDFFSQLRSISFIREFDPFEKYFSREKKALARDLMSTSYSAMAEDATLLEIIFELVVRKHPKVFVVRDGVLVGVIDRITVLDRVINF